jgi:hypothetical protein
MKKLLTIFTFILLTGCATGVPVMVKFPEVPTEMQVACPDLNPVDTKTDKLSDVLTVVTNNYTSYYECKIKIDSWIEWYTSQKSIFDKVSK